MQVVLIVNPKSGSGRAQQSLEPLVQALRANGWKARKVEASNRPALVGAARMALAEQADIVVACGGDGTVSAVASVIAGSKAALGIIPAGTYNHFARDLRIPGGFENATRLLLTGHTVSVDIGEVNGQRFVNNSSLGLYPHIVRYREERRKSGWSRVLAFCAACVVALFRFRFLRLRLDTDGKRSTRTSPFLFIGNNLYHMEGLKVGHRDRLDEGKLSVYLADRAGRLGLLRIAFSALLRRLRLNHDFVVLPAERLVVQTRRRRIRVALDGEVVRLHPPLNYTILPGILKVIAP